MIIGSTGLMKSLGLSGLLQIKWSLHFISHFAPATIVRAKRNERFQKKRGATRNGPGTGAVTKTADFIQLSNTFHVRVPKLRGNTRI